MAEHGPCVSKRRTWFGGGLLLCACLLVWQYATTFFATSRAPFLRAASRASKAPASPSTLRTSSAPSAWSGQHVTPRGGGRNATHALLDRRGEEAGDRASTQRGAPRNTTHVMFGLSRDAPSPSAWNEHHSGQPVTPRGEPRNATHAPLDRRGEEAGDRASTRRGEPRNATHVMFGLSGKEPGFLSEFQVAL